LLWALAKSFLGARYCRLLDLLRRFRVSYSKNGGETEQDILNEAGGYPLLILDEIGRQCGSAFEYNTIFDIIDTRYNNRLPTILCSNLPITGTESITAFLGIAAMDRLNENSVEISCNWENYRRGKR
jgi:DNA replication protein DnaC